MDRGRRGKARKGRREGGSAWPGFELTWHWRGRGGVVTLVPARTMNSYCGGFGSVWGGVWAEARTRAGETRLCVCAFTDTHTHTHTPPLNRGMYSYLFGLFAFLTSMCLGAARLDGSVTSAWWVILAPMFGAMVIFAVVIMHTACTYGLEMVSVADDPTQAGTETHREDGYDTWPLLGKVKVKRIQHDVFLGNCRGQREGRE